MKKKVVKKLRPRAGYYWERVLRNHPGETITPGQVAKRYKVDRAYACRILQSLVNKGHAEWGHARGEYIIGGL